MSQTARRVDSCISSLLIAILVGTFSSFSIQGILFAQEMGDEIMGMALIHYTLKYRFGTDLKVGDWIEYQLVGEGEKPEKIEIKVTSESRGGLWIEEKREGLDIHLLIDLKNMKVSDGYSIDEKGSKETAPPLSDEQLAQAVSMIEQMREQGIKDAQIITWEKGGGEENVEVPAGTFTCTFLEPVFSEEYIKQATDYGIDPEQMKQESRIYFNEEVPRMLPLEFTLGWIFYLDAFEDIKGGMVESKHMNLQLVDYGGE